MGKIYYFPCCLCFLLHHLTRVLTLLCSVSLTLSLKNLLEHATSGLMAAGFYKSRDWIKRTWSGANRFHKNEDIILESSQGTAAWMEKPIVLTKTYFITQKQMISEQGELPTAAARRAQKTDSVLLTTKLIMCRMVRSHRHFLSSTCGCLSVSVQKQADRKAGMKGMAIFLSTVCKIEIWWEKEMRKPCLLERWC